MPVTNMQPALQGGECVVIKTNSQTIEWLVQIGVADIYAIYYEYFYDKEQPLNEELQLIGAGNNMMPGEPVNFIFTCDGKWNQLYGAY